MERLNDWQVDIPAHSTSFHSSLILSLLRVKREKGEGEKKINDKNRITKIYPKRIFPEKLRLRAH